MSRKNSQKARARRWGDDWIVDENIRPTKFLKGKLNTGDIVFLNSGGPPMMVEARLTGNRVYCRWFSTEGILQEDSLPVACVTMWPGGRWQVKVSSR